jgi:hypothetical protein
MRRHLLLIATAALSGGASFSAQAVTQAISHADFSSVSDLTLNGSASQVGSELRLTPALGGQSGSAFSTQTIALSADASFSSFFSFVIRDPGGLGDGADGLTFSVQTVGSNVGGSGQGIGYGGISNSLAVEFDTFDNGESGGSNHVGIDLNGSVNSVASTGQLSPNFDNGQVWYAWVDYDGSTDALQVRWSQTSSRPFASMLDWTVDLPSVLGSNDAYVGFTSGTGAGWGEHNIESWSFINEYQSNGAPPPVSSIPEPETWALMLLGLGSLGVTARRRNRQAGAADKH